MPIPYVDLTRPREEREALVRAAVARSPEQFARVLGQCHGLQEEKRALAEQLLSRDLISMFQLALIRDLDHARRAELAALCIGNDDRINLLFEIARHDAEAVRPFFDQITVEDIRAALRAEGSDAWADAYAADYTRDHDPVHIKHLGQLYTEHAADRLYKLVDDAPSGHIPMIALAMESCGMFANNRMASWASDAFRAYIVSRDESPHHFGQGYDGSVPVCRTCDTPAERLITIDAESTQDAFALEMSPTFFWWRCACDNGNMLYVAYGDVPVDTLMSKGPVAASPLPYGAWALDKAERSVVAAHSACPKRGEHQVGGAPTWIRKNFNPRVPGLKEDRGMCFLASFDLASTPLGWMAEHQGIAYCFWDPETRVAVTQLQIESGDGGLFGF